MTGALGTIATLAVALIGGPIVSLLLIKRQAEQMRAGTDKTEAEGELTRAQANVALSAEGRALVTAATADAVAARKDATEIRRRIDTLEARMQAQGEHIERLERLMRQAGLEPPPFRWPPPAAATAY